MWLFLPSVTEIEAQRTTAMAMKESVANLAFGSSMMNDEWIEDGSGRYFGVLLFSVVDHFSRSGREGMVEHVSPRRKLDTDWRFSTTTTTVAVSAAAAAAALSPSLSFSFLRSGARLLSAIAVGGREGERRTGEGAGFGAKRNGEREREGEVLAGREESAGGDGTGARRRRSPTRTMTVSWKWRVMKTL